MNKYELIAQTVLKEVEKECGHNIIVTHWKSNRTYSGRAFTETYTIKTPEPKSDTSLNTFLHELGHLIYKVKPSCLNEYLACKFALDKMREHELKISRKIKRHHNWYIAFSLAQALNRNLKSIPIELKPYRKYLTSHPLTIIYGDGRRKRVTRYEADLSKC